MPAYMLIRVDVDDPAELKAYQAQRRAFVGRALHAMSGIARPTFVSGLPGSGIHNHD